MSLDISHEKIYFPFLEIQKEVLNRSYSSVALIFAVKIRKRLRETDSTIHQTKSVYQEHLVNEHVEFGFWALFNDLGHSVQVIYPDFDNFAHQNPEIIQKH